jgi:hypothetical protein
MAVVPVSHDEVRAYCKEHATMQVVWLQRKAGDADWTRKTGVMHDDRVEKVTQAILAKRFNLPKVHSAKTNDDTYVAFPSEEAEYADLQSLTRFTVSASQDEVRASVSAELDEMGGEIAQLRAALAAKDEELKRKPAPKPASAKRDELSPALLDGIMEKLGVTLGRTIAEAMKKPEANPPVDGNTFDPTDVRTWQGVLSPEQELEVAMDRLETKLRFEYGVVGDAATHELREALRSVMLWARNAVQTADWWSNDMAIHGQQLLDALRLEHAQARGLNKHAILHHRLVKERKEKRDHLGAAIAETERGRGRGRGGRGGRGSRSSTGFTPICYECRERGHTRPNCPRLRTDGQRSLSSNRDGGRPPQTNRL